MGDHLRQIQPPVLFVGGNLREIAKQPHRKIANLIALFHPGIQSSVILGQLRSVGLQPQPLGALSKGTVFGF